MQNELPKAYVRHLKSFWRSEDDFEAFRRSVVKCANHDGLTVAAERFEVNLSIINRWCAEADDASDDNGRSQREGPHVGSGSEHSDGDGGGGDAVLPVLPTPTKTMTSQKQFRIEPKEGVRTASVVEAEAEAAEEEVCLRWIHHSTHMKDGFTRLFEKQKYVDVMLVTEGRTIRCHKIVLASSSKIFEKIINNISLPLHQPVIYMHNIPHWVLNILVTYMYAGEVNVEQSQLVDVLTAAEELQITGLSKKTQIQPAEVQPQQEQHLIYQQQQFQARQQQFRAQQQQFRAQQHLVKQLQQKQQQLALKHKQQKPQQQALPKYVKVMPAILKPKPAKLVRIAIPKAHRQRQPMEVVHQADHPEPEVFYADENTISNIEMISSIDGATGQASAKPAKPEVTGARKRKGVHHMRKFGRETQSPQAVSGRKGTKSRPAAKTPKFYHEFEKLEEIDVEGGTIQLLSATSSGDTPTGTDGTGTDWMIKTEAPDAEMDMAETSIDGLICFKT